MICPTCGTAVLDTALFCPACGTRLVAEPLGQKRADGYPVAPPAAYAPSPTAPSTPPAAYAPNPTAAGVPPTARRSKVVPVVVGVLACIAVAALVLMAVRSCAPTASEPTSSPRSAVSGAFDAVQRLDVAGVLDAFPPEVVEWMAQSSGFASAEALRAQTQASVQQATDQAAALGIDLADITRQMGYKITGTSHYSADGLASLRNRWNERIPGFGDRIQDAAGVQVELSADVKVKILGQNVPLGDLLGSLTHECSAVQVDGNWYVLEMDFELPTF